MPGPAVRTDIVEVYVFRRCAAVTGGAQFLQMRRAAGALVGTWQPAMGHVEAGESAVDAALRELAEETGYVPGAGLLHLWQLEPVNTYFLARLDCVMLSPGFAAEVAPDRPPVLDAAHDDLRWVQRDQADRLFAWPGQRDAIEQIVRDILPADAPVADVLRIDLSGR